MVAKRWIAAALALTSPSIAMAAIAVEQPKPTGPYAFAVEVVLSPGAAKRMRSLGERVTVSAYYYGEATKAGASHTDEAGQIRLGNEQIELPASGGAGTITGRTVDPKHLAWILGRTVEVNVNVFSARRSGPDNLLDCSFFQDRLAVARAKTVRIACNLIAKD